MVVGSPTKLNLIPSGVMPVVYINQGDAGYDKEFLIYNGDSPYNVPAGVSATIRGKKADGYGVTEAAALTEGSNLVTITITEQMVAAAGANLYELVFVDTDGLRIATINMVWAVKKDALGDAVISESDLDYATQVMNQLQSVQAFKNQLDTNTDGLAAETAARIAADTTLQNNINAEAAARTAADNTLQSNINTEASTRSAQDGVLQAQIDQLVAPSGAAPSAAEIQNARVGADGITYNTLGDAIRTQINHLYSIENGVIHKQLALVHGALDANGNVIQNNSYWITDDYIPVDGLAYVLNETTGYVYIDGYNYANDVYTFVGYKRIDAGSIKYIPKHVTHIKLYAASSSQSFYLLAYTEAYKKASSDNARLEAINGSFDDVTAAVGSIANWFSEYGEAYSSTNRAITEFIPFIPNVTKIRFFPTFTSERFAYYVYDEFKQAVGAYDYYWNNEIPAEGIEILPEAGSYIRFVCRISSEADIDATALNNISNSITVYNDALIQDHDGVKFTSGYYMTADGSLGITANAATTDYIKAEPGTSVTALMRTISGTQWIACGLYDSEKRFIKRITDTNVYSTENEYKTLRLNMQIPDNGAIGYLRFSFGANYSDFQIIKNERLPLPDFTIASVNHRGFQDYAPENTIPAFQLSKAVGFKWVEFDVQFTADGVPVVIHDQQINRTARNADGSQISSSININNITYAEVAEYDFGYFFSSYYAGVKIPTFEEIIELCKNLGLNARIELKPETVNTGNIDALFDIVKKYGMYHNVEWVSFGHELINYIIHNYTDTNVGFIQSTISQSLIDTINAAITLNKNVSCAVYLDNTEEDFELLAATGCIIDIFTITTENQILTADPHVMSFTTNRYNAGEVYYNKNIKWSI